MFSRSDRSRSVLDIVETLTGYPKLPEKPPGYGSEPHPAKALSVLDEKGAQERPVYLAQKQDPDKEVPKVLPKKEPEKGASAPPKVADGAKKGNEAAPKAAPSAHPVWTPQQLEETAVHIHWCFTGWNHEENSAIDHIRRAHTTQNLPALIEAWRTRYPSEKGLLDYTATYLDVWCPGPSADSNAKAGSGWTGQANANPVYRNSERAVLMEVIHGSQAARDAANFYNRCHRVTDNENLLSFLETVAGFNREASTVTPEGALRFRNMIAAYNQFGWQTQDSMSDYRTARPTSSSLPPTNTYFDATIWYEFDETGLGERARSLIALARSTPPPRP